MSGHIGQQVGNYRLVQLLGQGSFGSVYLAEHLHLQTQAAVKILHQQVEEHEREAFIQEARTIASLKHNHILRVLDFGFERGMPYLVTEYAPNKTLRQKHPRGNRIPATTILTYTRQLASGLQYAHNQELIHRDIKPENVLFDEHDQIVLSDFGIALKGSRKLTEKDIAGTATYMAPELFQGKPRRASDQYALGVMVYEWLMGKPPFQGDFYGLVGQHITSPAPPLDNIPPIVGQVVLKALEKVPEDRYPTVTEFADALEQAVTKSLARDVRREPVAPSDQRKVKKPVVLQQSEMPPHVVPPTKVMPGTPVKVPSAVPVAKAMEQKTEAAPLPKYGAFYAFIIGLITGLLVYGVALSGSNTTFLLYIILAFVICCTAGFITGKVAVVRKKGWITGIVSGLTFSALAIANFPSASLLQNIINTVIVTLIAVPFIFCGVWLATWNHPYYRQGKRSNS